MPTYDYECVDCDHITEKYHGMSARPRVKCPECGSRMRKMLGTGAGVIFKGSGFYETDYRSDSYKAKAKADSSGSSSSTESSSKKSGDSSSSSTTSTSASTASKGATSKQSTSKSGSNGST